MIMLAFHQNVYSSSILLSRRVALKHVDYTCNRRVLFSQNKRVTLTRIISLAASGDNAKEEMKNIVDSIKEKGAEVYHSVEDNVKRGAEKLSETVAGIKEGVEEQIEDMSSSHSSKGDAKEKTKEVVDKLKEAGQSAMDEISDAKKQVEEKWEDWKQEHK